MQLSLSPHRGIHTTHESIVTEQILIYTKFWRAPAQFWRVLAQFWFWCALALPSNKTYHVASRDVHHTILATLQMSHEAV